MWASTDHDDQPSVVRGPLVICVFQEIREPRRTRIAMGIPLEGVLDVFFDDAAHLCIAGISQRFAFSHSRTSQNPPTNPAHQAAKSHPAPSPTHPCVSPTHGHAHPG